MDSKDYELEHSQNFKRQKDTYSDKSKMNCERVQLITAPDGSPIDGWVKWGSSKKENDASKLMSLQCAFCKIPKTCIFVVKHIKQKNPSSYVDCKFDHIFEFVLKPKITLF